MWADVAGQLVQQYGLLAVFTCVALEAMGLPLPGETVLVAASVVAANTGEPRLGEVVATATAAAILGDNAGYLLGHFGGVPLVRRYGHLVRIDRPNLAVGRLLFARHGGVVVFGGRFVSVLRTFAAFLAGMNHMPWRRFLIFNGLGGAAWAGLWASLAYAYGSRMPGLPAFAKLVVAGLTVLVIIGCAVTVRLRWRRLRVEAERAYPEEFA